MKKILICFGFIFILTGCTANYTIDISNGVIKEKLEVFEKSVDIANIKDETEQSFFDYSEYYGKNKNLLTSFYELYADDPCDESSGDECTFYNKKFLDEDGVGFELSHDFNITDYFDSSIPNEFVPGFEVSYDGKYLTISGGINWDFINAYDNLDSINITINTSYMVQSTNMKHNGNSYYFSVHKGDTSALNKIYITLDTEILKDEKVSNNVIILIVLLIILLASIIAILLIKKNRRINDL